MLAWVARLGVAGVEPLGLALRLSPSTLRSHLARLEQHELVVRTRSGIGTGTVVAITNGGGREALERGVDGVVERRGVSAMAVRHGRAVSWVAAWADVRGWRWLGPAELRADEQPWAARGPDGRRHQPDLGLILPDGRRIAVEVELHAKSRARLQAILRGYRRRVDEGAIDGVSYVSDRQSVLRLVRREAAEVLAGRLEAGPLDAVLAHVRATRENTPRREVDSNAR